MGSLSEYTSDGTEKSMIGNNHVTVQDCGTEIPVKIGVKNVPTKAKN